MKRLNCLFIFVFCLFFSYVLPVEKGSSSIVSVEPNASFPAVDTNNKMLAFGWFKNGFELEDSTTSCTFDSLFPVGGIVSLNGGKLYLTSDLHFSNDTTFSTFGIIYADDHILEYDSNSHDFSDPNNIGEMHNIELLTNADLTINDTLRFMGDCVFNAKGRSLSFLAGANVIVGKDSTLRVKNAVLKDLSEDKIRCVDDTSTLILDEVKWIQTGNYTFSIGSLQIVNDVDFVGTHTFFYESSLTLTIASNSTCKFADQLTAAFGSKGGLEHNKSVWFVDSSSKMELDNAKLVINPPGLALTRGSFALSKRVDIELNSTTTADGLILGDGTVKGDLSIICNPASYTHFPKGHWTYEMSNPDMIKSMSGFTKVAREDANTFYAKTDLTLSNITLNFSPYAPLLTNDGVEVKYNKCKIVIPGVKFGITGSRYTAAISLLDGNDEVFVEEGILPLYFLVKNSGNKIGGNGDLSGSIMLYDSDARVSLNLDGQVSNNISLNGGKLTLLRDLEFAQNSNFSTGGVVDYSDKDIFLGSSDLTLTNTIYWDGSDGALNLKSKVNLSGKWTFSGNCHVNGNGKILDLDGKGELVVERGSKLHLKNLKIYGITSDNIRALDDNAQIILDDVKFVQDTDYTFSVGSLQVLNKVNIFSPYSFYYESKQTLTINKNSQLKFSDGAILSIGMLGNLDNNKPIWWEDNTSILSLDNAKIEVGDSGFRVYRGEVDFFGRVDIDVNSSTTMNGLILGDGSEDGDLEVIYNPASLVSFNTGTLTYDMVRSDGIKSMSNSSRIKRSNGHYFYAKNNLYFDNITIEGSAFAVLDTVPDVYVGYNNCKMVIPGVKLGITGSRYNAYTSLLDGDDEVFLQEGVLPIWLLVKNSRNSISGNGSVSGQITLNDSDAQLTLNLDGQFLNNIVLNDSTLILSKDVKFSQGVGLQGSGIVDFGLNDFILGTADLNWTSTIYWDGDSGGLSLNSKTYLSSRWTFSGISHINGNGNILNLGGKGEILVERGSELHIKNLDIYGVTENNIRALDDSSNIILDNVRFIQSSDYTFSVGSLEVLNELDISGKNTFYYESTNSLIVNKNSQLKVSDDSTFALGQQGGLTNNHPVYFYDKTSKLILEDSNLSIGDSGCQFCKGTLICSGVVGIDVNSSNSQTGFILGDGTSINDPEFIVDTASSSYFTGGVSTYNITKPNGISSKSFTSVIRRSNDHSFYVKQNFLFKDVTVQGGELAIVDIEDGSQVCYDNCKMIVPGVTFNITGSYYNSYTSRLDGDDEIFLQEGVLPICLLVENSGNSISGNGSVSGQITLNDSDAQLTLNLDGQFLNNIVLNDSKLILSKDVELSQGVMLKGTGVVDLGFNDFFFGSSSLNLTSTIYWDANDGAVDLNSNLYLSGKWTFSGISHINGNGNILDLGGKGKILVERGSELHIKNLDIYGINQDNIRAIDNNSRIILDNVRLIQDTDYTFSIGSLNISNEVDVCSPHTFYYESKNTLTIHKNSELKFSNESSLALGMLGNLENNKPIWWEDSSSILGLDNSKILVGDSGFRVFGGTVIFSGRVDIDINSTDTMNGMILGDGSASGDLDVIFNPASYVSFNTGALTYDMTKYNGIRSMSGYSKINRGDGQYFYVKRDLVFDNISINGSALAVLDAEPGVYVGYNNCSMSVPGAKFKITGSRYSAYASLLNGDDEVFLKEGVYPLYTLVLNSENSISGNGSLSGQVLLNDSSSELTLNLDGQFLNNIVMNNSKLILGKDTELSGGALIEGGGLVVLDSNDLILGSQDLSWSSTIYFDSSQATVELNSMLKLYSTWTFSGNCVLKGNNNILWLKPTAQIKVERGSTLELQGIRIRFLGGNKLKCEDDSGLIIFNACKTRLTSDYNFEKGSFYVDYKFDVKGSYTFNYQSSQVSEIGMSSRFRFFPGTTFNYAPSVAKRDLIYMDGCDACICLNDATLHSTTTGMHLTGGKIGVYADSYITSDATCKADGIIFGDGEDENNDVNIEVFPGATFDLLSGYLIYKNVN